MRLKPEPIRPEIRLFIEQSIHELLAPYAVRDIQIGPGDDHDGDPVIFVDTNHDLSETPVDTKVLLELSTRILDTLWAMDETRFAHVRNHWDDSQKGSWDT
jgi:hypothetical protein